MNEFSSDEAEERKKAVFEAMSPRRQKHILKKGYDKWELIKTDKDLENIRGTSYYQELTKNH